MENILISEFIFNEHDVCLNPEIIVDIGDSIHRYKITLCYKDGYWGYGYSACGGYSMGESSPCNIIESESSKSRQFILDKVSDILKAKAQSCLFFETSSPNNTEEFQRYATKYLEWYNNRNQLTLF